MAAGIVAVIAIALAMVFAVLDGDDATDDPSAAAVPVSLSEYTFAPDPIVAPEGGVELTNDGAIEHNFVVPELGKGLRELAPGESELMDLSDQPAGTYAVVCDLTGHREQGMETTLELG